MKFVYALFPILVILTIVEMILHLFKISIPGITIDPKMFSKIKESDIKLKEYHRRHAISCLIVTPLITIAVMGNINSIYRVIIVFIVYVILYIVKVKDNKK